MLVAFCGALLLSLGGLQWTVQQIALAGDFKSELITGVLGLGLVIIGPVLLWALTALLPRRWFRAIGARLRQLVFNAPSGASRR